MPHPPERNEAARLSARMAMRLQKREIENPLKRVFAGAVAAVFFAFFFALPLYAAAVLCTMPCCEHNGQSGTAVSAMAACATTCAMSALQAKAPAVVTLVPEQQSLRVVALSTVTAFVSQALIAKAPIGGSSAPVHRTADAPLHVANSVFRI